MVNYWKSKVLPTIKKVFDKNGKKAAAVEACKSFDESKEEITKEFEEKKTELQPKVVEIYEASAVEIKTLVKKPTQSGLKKKSTVVVKFVEELVKIDFPGSKPVSEAAGKYGAGLVSGPVIFIFEKVCTLLPVEEPPAAVESTSKDITPEAAAEIKKEEEVAAEKVEEEAEAAPPAPPAPTEDAPAPAAPAEPAQAEPAPESSTEPAKA
ncbi:plasma membrane-associated cation-binding protein 1-like [Canna indica]|uniref:Plasma membrane-associated cation-binding protein 1-like n=1 Tax=Canna indica TaxID=4628 RepID=A0AAQ3K5C5_9LILI|nr:plasma membrane-associated cation-binding protein 1-like [Canna indica]